MDHFNRFEVMQVWGLLGSALLILILLPVGGNVDHLLSLPWIDQTGYYLKDNEFLVSIGHVFLKNIVIALASIHLLMWVYLAYIRSTSPLKMIAAMVVIGMLTSVSIIGILKANSVHACPWSIVEVSGTSINWHKPVNGLGRCFPGGHASAGFSLFILYFAYRLEYPKLARLALIFALFMGTMMSVTQMLRGAHFLSHNLWALWWSWCVDVLVYKGFMLSIFAKSSKVQAQNSKLA